MKVASWVVVDKQTGKAVMETFNRKTADAINLKKYDVLPTLEYLQKLNRDLSMERKSNPTKKFSPAQIAAQKLFAERARAGTLKKNLLSGTNPRKNTMKTFNFSANGVDFGDYKATTLTEAKTKFAHDAGYKSWSYMVSEAELSGGNNIEIVELTGGGGFVRRNPDKSKPRAYVMRASQATGRPPVKGTKAGNRLITRRKKALSAPAGYFPNPKAAAMMTGYQVIGMLPKKNVVGIFKTMARAKNIATFMADANGVPYGVKTVKVHKAHFAV